MQSLLLRDMFSANVHSFSQAPAWVCCPLFVHLLLAGWIGVCQSPPEGGVIFCKVLLDRPSISLSLD